jgi:hypothetical protein
VGLRWLPNLFLKNSLIEKQTQQSRMTGDCLLEWIQQKRD